MIRWAAVPTTPVLRRERGETMKSMSSHLCVQFLVSK